MKTIPELNSKWWYRLAKVVYGSMVLLILGISVSLTFYAYAPDFNIDESYVECDDGRRFSVSNLQIYGDYVSPWVDKTFRTWCSSVIGLGSNGGGVLEIENGSISDEVNYTFIAQYTPRDWARTIGYSLLAVFVAMVITEITRRVLYYVALGKFHPPKGD